jgi:predicted ATPase/DNA-binding winged helix-turn-helix (wHTH) protein
LLERRGKLATKDELLDACWPEIAVSDTVLKVCIREIREALGDDSNSPRFIETAHRRGYRFIGEITEERESGRAGEREPREREDQENMRQGERETTSVSPGLPLSRSPALPLSRSPALPRSVPLHISGAFRRAALSPIVEIVGREEALGQMRAWLERAMGGERQVIFVTGEAGIGKTTLLEAFLRRVARDARVWIALGQCLEQYGAGGSEAFFPVLEAISRLCQEDGRESLADLLRRRAPAWVQQMPWLAGDADHAQLQRDGMGTTRERMLREMAETLEALTTKTTLVLALEDLHWSDYSTLDLISHLARRREPGRLMIVGTYRPVELTLSDHPLKAVKQELQIKRQCEELPLEYLSEGNVGKYLEARFAPNEFPDDLGRLIHTRTEGNPLFMTNVADYLQTEGLIARAGGRWRLQVEPAELALGVPESIRQMIEKQIGRLSQPDQRALEAASLAGPEFSAAAVAAALEEDPLRTEERLEELARRHSFLEPTGVDELPNGIVTARYAFIHALYQNALYERITVSRRARMRNLLAARGEQVYGERRPHPR